MIKDLPVIDMSNVRWFHPGLGKTQGKIMDIVEEEGKRWEWIPIYNLTAKVYHPDLRGDIMWMEEDYPVTRSQTNTVHRAVKSLEKIGLVSTMKSPVWTRVGFRNMTVVGILSTKGTKAKREREVGKERLKIGDTMNKEEKDKEKQKRDPFGEKVFFSVGRDSDGCLSVYTPEQIRGEEPYVGFSPRFVKLLLLAGEFEYWPDEIVKGIREAWEKIEQQDKEEEEREKAS